MKQAPLILTVKESTGYWICQAKIGRKIVAEVAGLTRDIAMTAMIKKLASAAV
jgi:hypothetical protein